MTSRRGELTYIACENPDDVRMRFMIAAYTLNIDLLEIADKIVIYKRREKPEDLAVELKKEADRAGPFTLIIVETFAAFFDGKDMNDAVQGGEFARRVRPFTQIAGLPAVVVACHPVKNASEDQLIPYGSGAILNEFDGNLTLWNADGSVTFHWQGKLRGLDFAPLRFHFETLGSPDVKDVKGREVHLPYIRPSDEAAVEDRKQVSLGLDRKLVAFLIENGEGTLSECASALEVTKWSADRRLKRLKTSGLVTDVLGKWSATLKAERPRKKQKAPATNFSVTP